MHPFAKARERQRALNAVKMERMFSKPFIGALEGHTEGVELIVKQPKDLKTVASAGWDGGQSHLLTKKVGLNLCLEILVHDLPHRETVLRIPHAHKGKVSGICYADDERLLSCGVDCNVKLWDARRDAGDTRKVLCHFIFRKRIS
jgi:WD repeat and SOF domain-containing protein 1